MNIQQTKRAVSAFRNADASIIKDDLLRAKAQRLQMKQKGFTLLELLVVITLLAVLAVGALVAYENIGDNAEAVAAANAGVTLDSAIRTYRAVEAEYPNQWDSPVVDGAAAGVSFLATPTTTFIATWADADASTAGVSTDMLNALVAVGIEEIQYINDASAAGAPSVPNLAHNESNDYGAAFEVELEDGDKPSHWSVIPSDQCAGLSAAFPSTTLNGTVVVNNNIQNAIGDVLEGDECHVVIALGFGSDAASSTTFSNVAISQSPTYIHSDASAAQAVNPAVNYSRFFGLFHVGEFNVDTATWEPASKARLIAVVSPDGKRIDELVTNMQD